MNVRRLAWLGVAIAVGGALLSFILHFAVNSNLFQVGFFIEPSVVLLLAALILSLCFLGVSAFLRWQQTRIQNSLDEQRSTLEKERRRFIGRLDHEMKNPLTAIQVQLDNLQENVRKGPEVIADVRTQVERLSLLTRGLRRLADLETRTLEKERVEVEELLQEVVDLLQAQKRIQLDVQRLPWPVPPIDGDRELLLVAFRNLVDNALRYSKTSVQVRARHTAGHLIVEVIDTGRGIPPEELPMVKEELYRGSNVHDIPGSGLGLAMVETIIVRHGGSLEIRSRPGQGTITTVQIAYEQV
jgi:two-component system OmpR family sensor kinase